MEYMKQLNKIIKTIEEIPFKEFHISITTETDTFLIDKKKETLPIGFRK